MNLAFCIILHWNCRPTLLVWGHVAEHVEQKFVIDLDIWNFDGDLSIETAAYLGENRIYCSRNETSVFVVLSAACHSESFSSRCLTVAHNCAVNSIDYSRDGLLTAVLKNVFLRGVVHQFVKFELPRFGLIVNMAAVLILRNLNCDSLMK